MYGLKMCLGEEMSHRGSPRGVRMFFFLNMVSPQPGYSRASQTSPNTAGYL